MQLQPQNLEYLRTTTTEGVWDDTNEDQIVRLIRSCASLRTIADCGLTSYEQWCKAANAEMRKLGRLDVDKSCIHA